MDPNWKALAPHPQKVHLRWAVLPGTHAVGGRESQGAPCERQWRPPRDSDTLPGALHSRGWPSWLPLAFAPNPEGLPWWFRQQTQAMNGCAWVARPDALSARGGQALYKHIRSIHFMIFSRLVTFCPVHVWSGSNLSFQAAPKVFWICMFWESI